MNKYPLISFRPTKEMQELIEIVRRDTGLTPSEIMRNIISDYIIFIEKTKNGS